MKEEKRLSELDRAIITAIHFGFNPIPTPKITRRDLELVKDCHRHPHYDANEKMAMVRTFVEGDLPSHPIPLAVVYKRLPVRGKHGGHSLHFIGSTSGIAEATLIRAALSILTEEGHGNLRVEINCIGDKESIALYERELINHVRKLSHELSEDTRNMFREDIFNIFRTEMLEAKNVRESAPPAMSFLSAASRSYFKEVLEYLDGLGVEFRLNPELVGDRHHSSHAIFVVKNSEEEKDKTLAVGYRYSRLSRFLGLRKEVPMASATILPEARTGRKEQIYKELPRTRFYLIQLGQEAQIRTLPLLELLRRERIPVEHMIGAGKISAQLTNAEETHASHLIIIGQKEALDNTVTIRNMLTRAQDTVSVTDLPRFLKHLTF